MDHYLTTAEYARRHGYSTRAGRVKQFAREGRLVVRTEDGVQPGAIKLGRDWVIHPQAEVSRHRVDKKEE